MITLQERVHGAPPPPSWSQGKLHLILRVRKNFKNIGMQESNLLSLSYGRIIRRDIEAAEGLLPESFETYQIVEPGNIVMRLTDLQNDKRSLRQGLVHERGIITSAYDALDVASGHDPRFWAYALLALDLSKYYYSLGGGVRQSINFADFPNDWIGVPDIETQQATADFLDRETARIDQLIQKKTRLLLVMKEKLLILISEAVTRGLDTSVPMVESGIAQTGRFPKHWEFVMLGKKIRLQRGVDITKDQQEDGPYPVVSSGGVDSYHNEFICHGPGVLIGRKGSAGKLHYEERNYWPHDTTLYVRSFGGNVPKFAYYKLMSIDLLSYDTGSANPTINRNIVHPTKVSWPPVTEQHSIVSYLDDWAKKHEQVSERIRLSVERLGDLRYSLITAAATGQIDLARWHERRSTDRHLHSIDAEIPA
jgi:type I restriction enzyme, S subunit